mgnify:FL=1
MYSQEEESDDAAEKKVSMPYHEQVDAFNIDLDNLITRYRNEFELTLETMIGCLEVAKVSISDPMIMDLGRELLGEEEENEQE